MTVLDAPKPDYAPAESAWPSQADLILSALEAGRYGKITRRTRGRNNYRVRAFLRLFSDGQNGSPKSIYTRDLNEKGLGFITPHRLPLGYGAMLELPQPDGQMLRLHCTLLRCREAAPGWFEGALYFNREQADLAV